MVEVEIFPRHAIDVLHGDLLDLRQLLVRGADVVKRQGVRPVGGEAGDGVLIELRGPALLQLRGRDEPGGNAALHDVREDGADGALQRLGILPGGERYGRIGDAGLRQRSQLEVRVERLALRHEAEEREAAAVEDIGEHVESGEVATVEARCAHRDHCRAIRLVRTHGEGGGMRLAEAHLWALGQLLRPDGAEKPLHLEQGGSRIDVTGDHQDGVVRRIPAVMELLQHCRGRGVERGAGTECIVRVRCAGEHLRAHLFVEDVVRIGPILGHLLLDRAALRLPLAGRVEHATHTGRLDVQRHVEILRGNGEEVLGHALARVGVEIAAHDAADIGELVGGEARAAAKHHVLLRVRHARESRGRFIAARQVIHRCRDYRRQRIPHHDHPQAIRQCLAGDLRPKRIACRRGVSLRRCPCGKADGECGNQRCAHFFSSLFQKEREPILLDSRTGSPALNAGNATETNP